MNSLIFMKLLLFISLYRFLITYSDAGKNIFDRIKERLHSAPSALPSHFYKKRLDQELFDARRMKLNIKGLNREDL